MHVATEQRSPGLNQVDYKMVHGPAASLSV